jgi:hypothetical protein
MEQGIAGPTCLKVHPIYGAIYHDGEFVQRGAVLGLSVDCKEVVVAPISGWVRIGARPEVAPSNVAQPGLCVEIWQQPSEALPPPAEKIN